MVSPNVDDGDGRLKLPEFRVTLSILRDFIFKIVCTFQSSGKSNICTAVAAIVIDDSAQQEAASLAQTLPAPGLWRV